VIVNGPQPNNAFQLAVLIAAGVWLGLLIGVSFIATPIKFSADSLSLPVALEIGRVTFALLNRIEWAMLVLLIGSSWIARRSPFGHWNAHALCLILVAQTFWLLPVLDARVGAILAGSAVVPSYHHWVYIGADGTKLVLLAGIVWAASRRLLQRSP
jgi:hypothetical protein